jgi:dTDP-glucose pyrophosphorylase
MVMTGTQLVAQLSIGPQTTLLSTIEHLARAERKILLIVAGDGCLHGVVTDYDLRQAILNRHSLATPIGDIIKHTPVVAAAPVSDRDIIALMRDKSCHQIPILDKGGRPIDVRFYDEFIDIVEHPQERAAVVMAGGFGTRLRPMTDDVPKPLLEVAGRPILFILLDQIISEGFNKIYLTLYYKSQMIRDRIRDVARYRQSVDFIVEDEPLGTAGSLGLLPQRPLNPFLVINADLLTEVPLREMLDFHNRERNVVTVALKREQFEVPYGIAEVRDGRITALREKPALALDVNAGVYIASPEFCDHLGAGVKLDMPQVVNELLKAGARIGGFPIHEFWLDVGTHEHFNQAQIRYEDRVGRDR